VAGTNAGGYKALITLAATVVVLAALKWSAELTVPLLLAAFISAALTPLMKRLTGWRVPVPAAVTSVLLLVLVIVVGFSLLVGVAGSQLVDTLPRFESSFERRKLGLAYWLSTHRLATFAPGVLAFKTSGLAQGAVTWALTGSPDVIGVLGIIVFVTAFILLESRTFQGKLASALHWDRERFVEIEHTLHEVQKYMLVKVWLSVLVGLLCGLWCTLLGLENAVLWGLLSFALNFIPVFGSLIATVAPTAAALILLGPGGAAAVFAGLFVIHNVIGNVVEPKVMGHAMGLSPLVVTIGILFWGWLFGPVGALLSVPLTMIVKIAFANTDDLAWVAVLLGPGSAADEARYVERQRLSRTRRLSLYPPPRPPETTSTGV
jgi:AI-2 transport protein TqsA